METKITSENFKSIWESILIKATDKYKTPPEVIQVSNSTISTLGNFSASTGKGKSKKTQWQQDIQSIYVQITTSTTKGVVCLNRGRWYGAL